MSSEANGIGELYCTIASTGAQRCRRTSPGPSLEKGNPLRRLMTRLTLPVFEFIHTRPEARRIEILGRPFEVFPGVYNPRFSRWLWFPSSEHLALHLGVRPGERVLDVGTGIGVQAIMAALRGGRAVATDINPQAVACTARNAALNGVSKAVQTLEGDLFEPVRGARFDRIAWLPPSFPKDPVRPRHHGWMCGVEGQVLDRFCRQAGDFLRPEGRIRFSCVDRNRDFILSRLKAAGFLCRQIGRPYRRFPFVTVTLHEARRVRTGLTLISPTREH